MVDFAVVPKRMALINVDMQNCFVESSPLAAPGGRQLLDKVNRLTQACREAGVQVIHTAHVVRPDGSNVGVMGEMIDPIGKGGYLNKDRVSAALHPQLKVEANDIILDKPRYGSFHATDLELVLKSKGVDTIIVSGICTNICCETTAREAGMRDFHVFFLSDGTETFPIGDVSAAEIQRVTCATLGLAFAQIVTVDEMIRKLAAA